MIRYGLFLFALVFAVGDWFAVARDRRALEFVCKPATMLAVLIGAWLATRGPHDLWQARFFLPGFALSLAGDVFLMLRRERLFLAGLVAFLLAHICYIVGLNATAPPWPSLILMVPIAGIGAVLVQRLAQGVRGRGKEKMVAPVGIYGLVLSLMLFSAWATLFRPAWGTRRTWLAAIGASLFFISDAMLAWDRFVRSFARARLWIHMTYHLGQMALAASMLLPA